ncbi:hypothetical protein F0562_007877 [Nyssa sinensis]|uniref:N-acetyltransferase domain-containing protein n=1 Tax=Nyssa sinensis TaxID=561372 RepID=A0A5J5A559_9ASTE|nr:hypothetical protein F0562_007877 [Nyssa sinensis]
MAGKSKNRRNHSNNSSSDSSENEADPDYVGRCSQRVSARNNIFKSFEENHEVNMDMEIAEIGSSSRTSSMGRKLGRRLKKRDKGQEELQKIQISRKARARRKRISLDVESSTDGRNNNSDHDQKKKATILSWLIGSKTIQENTKVFCETTEGVIGRDGILCSCCNEVFTVMDFGDHAGHNLREPYRDIFISEPRVSLFSCMIEAWNRPEEAQHHRFNSIVTKQGDTDSHDDACIICADGGNLLCCDNCSSTYHQACMVHWECFRGREPLVLDLNIKPFFPFCGQNCIEVNEKLEKIVGARNDLDEGYTWTLLRRMDDGTGICVQDFYQKTECHAKLAVAWRVMEECFETIIDRHTKINMIQSVVYNCGSSFNRINFSGFYVAVLEKDDEIISAASLRIHGIQLAEMPFIATREIHRGKGMCRKLMTAIESALCYLKVENLVIPSISEKIGSWIEGYGFCIIEENMKKEIMCHNTLMFHDSLRLQKTLLPPCSAEPNNTAANEAMEVEAANEENQGEQGLGVRALFDLNLEPPDSPE